MSWTIVFVRLTHIPLSDFRRSIQLNTTWRTKLNTEKPNTISQTLLEILACPACKGKIEYIEKDEKLVCQGECKRRYPIRDGIPVMLIDEAELPDADNPNTN